MFRIKHAALLGLALGAALLAAAPAVVVAGGPPPKAEPRWALTWEAALAEAKERNVPIFITFHQDG